MLLIAGLASSAVFCARLAQQWSILPLDFSLPGPLVAALLVVLGLRAVRQRRVLARAAAAQPAGAPPVPAATHRGPGAFLLGLTLLCCATAAGLAAWGHTLAAGPLLVVALALTARFTGWGPWLRRRWPLAGLALLLAPVPIPARVPLLSALARLAAALAWVMARLTGLGATLDGIFVRTPEFYIKVIDSCSGFYMVLMFLVVALTVSALRRWPGSVGGPVVALAVPLGLLLNAARLTVILTLGQRDPAMVAVDTTAHDLPGVLLFAVGVALLVLLGRLLAARRLRQLDAGPAERPA